MKTRQHGSLLQALSGLAILAIVLCTPQRAWAGDPIVVIVNDANPLQTISLSELKKLFLGDKSHWDTGKVVVPVMVRRGAPERTAFLKTVCGMNEAELGKYFMQAAFTGKSITPPQEMIDSRSVKSMVASSIGAIGFVKAADFHGDGSDGGIRSMKIDGVVASDLAYKIRM